MVTLAPIWGLSCVMGATAYILFSIWPAWLQLGIQTAVGGLTYLALALALQPTACRHLRHILLQLQYPNPQSKI